MDASEISEGAGFRHGVLPHCDSTRSGKIIFRFFTAFLFVVPAREEDRLAVDHRLYAAAIPIEGELRGERGPVTET